MKAMFWFDVLWLVYYFILGLVAEDTDIFVINNPVPENHKNVTSAFKLFPERCGIRNGFYLNRIVGGREAEPGEFPWQVSIQTPWEKGYKHICGGAILNAQWIITAGHCVYDMNAANLSIVAGDHNLYKLEGFEQMRQVSRIFMDNFDITVFKNDVALLKLNTPFTFDADGRIGPICLPDMDDEFDDYGTVTGWGRLGERTKNTEVLMHATLPIITDNSCDNGYKRIGFSGFLNECQICAGYSSGRKDACQGDSGGPFVCSKEDRYYLCGIVSWGIGCARATFPGKYTKVTCFSSWIQKTIKNS